MSEGNGDRINGGLKLNVGTARRDRLDLGEIGQLLRRSYLLIAVGTVSALALVLAATLASRMTFRARGSLYLGELQERAPARTLAPGQWDFMAGESGDVGTEIEILRSQDLIRRAVLESGLNVTVLPAGAQPATVLALAPVAPRRGRPGTGFAAAAHQQRDRRRRGPGRGLSAARARRRTATSYGAPANDSGPGRSAGTSRVAGSV